MIERYGRHIHRPDALASDAVDPFEHGGLTGGHMGLETIQRQSDLHVRTIWCHWSEIPGRVFIQGPVGLLEPVWLIN
jgi:hypothetical protein